MNRREAVSRVALILGGTIVGAEVFLSGCKPEEKKGTADLNFSAEDIAYLDEIAETIIPTTDTPGAKSAKVGAFMAVMVKDCYTEADQQIFVAGMNKLNEASEQLHKRSFMDASPEQRKTLLTAVDNEQKAYTKNKKKRDPEHYFALMKQLTLLGYFTSETGVTQALRYLPVPTRYDGEIPYKKGDKAWAT